MRARSTHSPRARSAGTMSHQMEQLARHQPLDQMIQSEVIDRGITDKRVIAAMREAPRDKFFATDPKGRAFAGRALPIGHGQTISEPYIVALMTERLMLEA